MFCLFAWAALKEDGPKGVEFEEDNPEDEESAQGELGADQSDQEGPSGATQELSVTVKKMYIPRLPR